MPVRTFEYSELPSRLLFDTSFLIDLVVETQDRHDAAAEFFERIKRADSILCLVSVLAFAEFSNGVARLFLASTKSTSLAEAQTHLRNYGPADVVKEVAAALDKLDEALGLLGDGLRDVSLDPRVWEISQRAMYEYGFQPYDAVHVGSALYAGCADIVSHDRRAQFDKVPGFTVWRDRL